MSINLFKNINFRLLLFYFLTAICAAISIEILQYNIMQNETSTFTLIIRKFRSLFDACMLMLPFFEQTEMDNFHFIISLGYILFISNMVFQDISDSDALFILFFIRQCFRVADKKHYRIYSSGRYMGHSAHHTTIIFVLRIL